MQQTHPNILAIETSCDETAAAVIRAGAIASNLVATQAIHTAYGGVVPELASRAHQQHIVPVVTQALQAADCSLSDLDAIAFTQGPGLLGALLIGTSFAKATAFSLGIPLVAVHHMRAHILANFIDSPHPPFPFLCLTVSGGHTQIVRVESPTVMEVIGTTQDDAVGEAFDKIGKLMAFPYPAGPMIDKYAQNGDATAYSFPATSMPHLDFSFSGIKTAFLHFLKKHQQQDDHFVEKHKQDICASIQAALVAMLLSKLKKAAAHTGIHTVALAGGVAANTGLRRSIQVLANKEGWEVFIPQLAYCTDNAAMVAMAAHYQYLAGDVADISVMARPRMPL